jgi:hypothetical protein
MSAQVCDGDVSGDHEFGEEVRYVGHGGPLDGEWIIRGCLQCNAFEMAPRSGGPALELVLAKLTELGCDPRERTTP